MTQIRLWDLDQLPPIITMAILIMLWPIRFLILLLIPPRAYWPDHKLCKLYDFLRW